VADADHAIERFARELLFQIPELAFGTPAREHAVLERGDAGGIIAAVFEALERIDQQQTGSWPMIPIMPHMLSSESNQEFEVCEH
jgi:hypothetical protein